MAAKRIGMVIMLVLGLASGVLAKDNVLGLDSSSLFNIYVSNGTGGIARIENVDIAGFREIAGIVFLVVQEDGFNSKSSEGLIRMDSVQAVLPALRAIRLQNVRGSIK